MAIRYPKNPKFNRLAMRSPDFTSWQEGCAHDPALLEWEGRYYAYSTDTFGAPSGYQIRVSEDLLHWNYLGTALAYGKNEKERAAFNMTEAFDWCVSDSRKVGYGVCVRKDGEMSFWAPHCIHGTDGKFWLYFCVTGYFGGSKSCIGLAKSSSPEGPFVCEQILVKSPTGWVTPNAIDPQVFFAEDRMFLVYGSFGLGIFLIELDPKTGLRKKEVSYQDFADKKLSLNEYYGTCLASGSLEGAVIRLHTDVPVLEDGKWVKKKYYYLMCSYGSLSSAYNIRCGRSERPEGPYTDVNGNPLICSTDIGTGNKMLGSFRWEDDPVDKFCPGHNDMFVTGKGVRLIVYHCRTNYFVEKNLSSSNNFHFLYLGQYDFNSDGWPVMNANRYAGEQIQKITAEEFLSVTDGNFEAVKLIQRVITREARRLKFHKDGRVSGAMSGSWYLYGSHYISVTLDGEEYLGVVMPAWIEHQNTAGLTVTAMGKHSGMALLMNTTIQI